MEGSSHLPLQSLQWTLSLLVAMALALAWSGGVGEEAGEEGGDERRGQRQREGSGVDWNQLLLRLLHLPPDPLLFSDPLLFPGPLLLSGPPLGCRLGGLEVAEGEEEGEGGGLGLLLEARDEDHAAEKGREGGGRKRRVHHVGQVVKKTKRLGHSPSLPVPLQHCHKRRHPQALSFR